MGGRRSFPCQRFRPLFCILSRERKLNTTFFFSNFSGAAWISQQNQGISHQKGLIPRTFWPPPLHVEDPYATRSYSEAQGPPQFQEKRSRSDKAILGALGAFRGILGAALGVQNIVLGMRNPILGMASHVLLRPFSRNILWNFSSKLPGNFAVKNAGDVWWIFYGLRFPRNEARELLKNSEQNSGQNSGQKFEKFGELSFCKFCDLATCAMWKPQVSEQLPERFPELMGAQMKDFHLP